MQSEIKSFRELVENNYDDYEPLALWLIPLYLRSREQYYEEAANSIRKHIEDLWVKLKVVFPNRDDFDKLNVIDSIWQRYTPYWWGLNDVIGWIDIRLCVRSRQIQISVFLPAKRISRRLKDKKFGFQYLETIDLPDIATNEELQNSVLAKLNSIIQDKRINKFFVDIEPVSRMIRHTNLVSVIKEFDHDDLVNFSKTANSI